jgi:hypothetical protein
MQVLPHEDKVLLVDYCHQPYWQLPSFQSTKCHPADIWDTAGQERFNSMHASYYYRAHACIMVFDVTRKVTYKNLQRWYDELQVRDVLASRGRWWDGSELGAVHATQGNGHGRQLTLLVSAFAAMCSTCVPGQLQGHSNAGGGQQDRCGLQGHPEELQIRGQQPAGMWVWFCVSGRPCFLYLPRLLSVEIGWLKC